MADSIAYLECAGRVSIHRDGDGALDYASSECGVFDPKRRRRFALPPRSKLNKREIKLLLEDQRVAVDIQRAQVILDLVQHVAL